MAGSGGQIRVYRKYRYTMKRIAIFLSAASLAVTGIISCEKEPDTGTPVSVESVSLDKNALAIVLEIDETKTLTATVYPETATDKTVKWESADPETASVDENGVVKGLPAAGQIQGSSLLGDGESGYYWAGERWSHMLDVGEHLYFNGNANYFDNIGMSRFCGVSVRPVVGPAE